MFLVAVAFFFLILEDYALVLVVCSKAKHDKSVIWNGLCFIQTGMSWQLSRSFIQTVPLALYPVSLLYIL